MRRRLVVCLIACASLLPAQRRVDPKNSYSRILAVVPLTGTGTPASPKRPEYAPWPVPTPTAQSSITAFYWVPTDDGHSAIVEFVAPDMTAFKQILADKTITIFVRGKDSKSTIETALQKLKKGFSLETFGMVL